MVNFREVILLLFTLTSSLLLFSCSVESNLSADLKPLPDSPGFDEDGAAIQVLDATKGDVWVYFDMDTNSVVTLEVDEEPENNAFWDIAFKRFLVKVNGGVSGNRQVSIAVFNNSEFNTIDEAPQDQYETDRGLIELSYEQLILLDNNDFFAVCKSNHERLKANDEENPNWCLSNNQVDQDNLNPETQAYVMLTKGSGRFINEDKSEGEELLGWYDYHFFENHILRPADDIWVVKTTENNYLKLEMLGYTGYQEGDGESGTMAFRFKSLTPGFDVPAPGAKQLRAIIENNLDDEQSDISLNQQISFNAQVSGAEGDVSYRWNMGDGTVLNQKNIEYAYTSTDLVTITLTVTDERGAAAVYSVMQQLNVVDPDSPGVGPVADAGTDQVVTIADTETSMLVNLDASASTDADGIGNIISYTWKQLYPTGVSDPHLITAQSEGDIELEFGSYIFELKVTDASGNQSTDTISITVNSQTQTLPVVHINSDKSFINLADVSSKQLTATSTITGINQPGDIVSWNWSFNNSSSATNEIPPVQTIDLKSLVVGSYYDVLLSVTDVNGETAYGFERLPIKIIAPVTQDTYYYEFLGNQGENTGDSDGVNIWNHNSNHGAKALLRTAIDWNSQDIIDVLPAQRKIILYLHQKCEYSGFVGACAGDAGAPLVTTDVLLQMTDWNESDNSVLSWSDINEADTSTTKSILTQSTNLPHWVYIDVTELVESWIVGQDDFGFAMSQESYGVIRADNGSIAVASFCDSESSSGYCATGDFKPYIEVISVP